MRLTVEFADGRNESVRVAPSDLVKFERKYDMPAADIEGNPRVEYMMFLAWAAMTRAKTETRDFDTFLDDLAEIGADDEGHPPTPPA